MKKYLNNLLLNQNPAIKTTSIKFAVPLRQIKEALKIDSVYFIKHHLCHSTH